uniref:Uncharacterized protein n=1 Tax=Globodera rostochiensis TaxID=31243 RepID=A0A914IFK5_GLORO
MGTNGVGKEEVTTALGRGRMSGLVRGARPRMGPADGVHERGQWRVGHERGQWRAGHMSGANGGWRTNVFQLKCGVKFDKIDIRQRQESIHSAILRKMEHIFGKIVQYSRPNLSIFFGMMMKVDSSS